MVTNRTPVYDSYGYYGAEENEEEREKRDVKNRTLGKILKRYGVRTVLDLTCGTGNQVLWLIKHGYKVIGSDISSGSLRVARYRARKQKLKARFLAGDMRTVKVGKFDAAITIFNSVGHLSKAGFEKAMRNIRWNLNDGGLYLFDILNADMNDKLEADLLVDSIESAGKMKVHKLQVCRINRNNGILTMDETFCTWRDHGRINISKPVRWTMQIYTAKELRVMLSRNGFRVLGQYAWPSGSKFRSGGTMSILTVARKA